MASSRISLLDSTTIPALGYGTYQIDGAAGVAEALAVGYRHLDTAQSYGNEAAVGEAIARSGLARDDVYVTTKLGNGSHEPAEARRAFADSLARLGLEHVDLYLIHWPMPHAHGGDFPATWRVLGEFLADGRARSIGVSNFNPEHLDRLVAETGVVPVVNQVECHPGFANRDVVAANDALGVVTVAWSPIGRGAYSEDPVVRAVAEETGRTPAQVVLRWHLDQGRVAIPRSQDPARMRENLDLDFTLDEAQLARIDGLDRGAEGRTGPDPAYFG